MLPDLLSIRAKEKYFRALEGDMKYDAINEIIEKFPCRISQRCWSIN